MKQMSEDQGSIYCKGCGRELGPGVEFCPSCGKEKGIPVMYKKHTGSTWGSGEMGLIFFGGFLVIAGLMPFFMMDTSLTGVTSTIRLWTSAGIAGVAGGLAMILVGVLVPRLRVHVR